MMKVCVFWGIDGRETQKKSKLNMEVATTTTTVWHDRELRSMSWCHKYLPGNRIIDTLRSPNRPVMGFALQDQHSQNSANIPLQTRSSVDTWDPSSIVCSVKSISGGGLFSLTARIVFSSFWLLSRTIPPALGSAIVLLDLGDFFFVGYEE